MNGKIEAVWWWQIEGPFVDISLIDFSKCNLEKCKKIKNILKGETIAQNNLIEKIERNTNRMSKIQV